MKQSLVVRARNTENLLVLVLAVAMLSGCAKGLDKTTMRMESAEYAAKEPISTSLFPSDQAILGDEAVAKIFSSKLELPAKAKLALMKFRGSDDSGSRYGNYYWRDEEYLKLQQVQVETLSTVLLTSDQIEEVTPLPSLMTPRQASIPLLREAAVRMQADMLLVYRISSDTYSQYRAFAKDKVKAYSTCELVLLDVRTGLVPFTRVISRERLELKQSTELDLAETMRRAEQESAIEALKTAAEDLVRFVKAVPRKAPAP
jgi:hypothetical protein